MVDTNNAIGIRRTTASSTEGESLDPSAFRSQTLHGNCSTSRRAHSASAASSRCAPVRDTFFWRKLHSLLGIVPIGAFLLEHLLSNFEALKGPVAYGEQVKFLNSLPLVRVLEWVFIFLPHPLSRHLRHL